MARASERGWVEARALIERPGRQLLIHNPEPRNDASPWEFPGGRAEGRESPEAALRRVFRDVHHAVIEIHQGQPPFVYNFGDRSVTYRYYLVSVVGDEPVSAAGGELRWVHVQQLRDYHFDGPGQQVVDWLVDAER